MRLYVPDLDQLRSAAMPWSPGYSGGAGNRTVRRYRHTVTPPLAGLAAELAIDGTRVLAVAGFYADWARALAVDCHVTYSDLSPEFVELASASGAFRDVICGDYIDLPATTNAFDWTFAFEPVGGTSGGLALCVMRALLNELGAVFLFHPPFHPGKSRQLPRIFGCLASMYGATFDAGDLPVALTDHLGADLGGPVVVLRLLTNEAARARAARDLAALPAIGTTVEGPAPGPGTLRRLDAVARLLSPRLRREVTVA